ncbi:hypothetical protein ON010_g1274 [Phytophthora cinnamomi]|nr:hypothetical protein ON010_g1274 [Phytophthora cinnamomi]
MSAPSTPDAKFLAEMDEFLLEFDLPTFPLLQALDVGEPATSSPGAHERVDINVSGGDSRTSKGIKPPSTVDAAAKLERVRAKDRKRRSACRERERQEKEHLRQEIGELTEELEHLQKTKEHSKLVISAPWEMVAKWQQQARLNAEAHQRRLCAAIESRTVLLHELQRYVNEGITDNSQDLLLSGDHQHKRLRIEPSDAKFYETYWNKLDVLYEQTDMVLRSCGLCTTTAGSDDPKQQWNEKDKNGFYTFVDKQTMPFGFKETSDTLWTVGSLQHRQEGRQAYLGPPNTLAFKFRNTTQLKSGRVVSVLQRVVSRRYDEDGKTVVVWRSFTEGEGLFTGMHADWTGWCVATPLTSSSLPETLLRLVIYHVPMHFSSGPTQDDCSKQFTRFTLEAGTEDVVEATNALGRLLLNEKLVNSSPAQ